jgi:lactoylglutathione lyase
MRRSPVLKFIPVLILSLALGACRSASDPSPAESPAPSSESTAMRLGNFSVSLTVSDIAKSRAFYEKLGFEAVGGDQAQNWLVMKNGPTKIGLFQGMFESNILTFNPGWDENGHALDDFEDVRDLQARIVAAGIQPLAAADAASEGPASFVIVDPDGNTILIDQHVNRP